MASMLPDTCERPARWRRELIPVIAVAGLAADYLSPPAAWTILLPFGCVALLLGLRKPVAAALVFLLSSWVLLPSAARLTLAVEDLRGARQLLVVDGATMPSLADDLADPCLPAATRVVSLPFGSGHLVNPRWALRRAIVTFADVHNAMVIERWHRGAWGCRPIPADE
jgi:hypothetical protein